MLCHYLEVRLILILTWPMFLFAVEVASRNELGLHTSWKPASWQSAHRTASLVKIDGATLTVKQNGLYLIYAQVNTRSTLIHLYFGASID